MSLDELGAIAGYASQVSSDTHDKGFGRWLWLMIGTACRPEAALAFDPLVQWKDGLIDTHPKGAPRTKKHNPVVAAAPALAKMLDAWREQTLADGKNSPPPKSRGRAWRTMRRALVLPVQYIPKTIRHTVATELRRRGVPAEQISVPLGHRPADLERMTAVYAKYDPRYLAEAVTAHQALLMEVNQRAKNWSAEHRVVKIGNAPVSVIAVDVVDEQPSCSFSNAVRPRSKYRYRVSDLAKSPRKSRSQSKRLIPIAGPFAVHQEISQTEADPP